MVCVEIAGMKAMLEQLPKYARMKKAAEASTSSSVGSAAASGSSCLMTMFCYLSIPVVFGVALAWLVL